METKIKILQALNGTTEAENAGDYSEIYKGKRFVVQYIDSNYMAYIGAKLVGAFGKLEIAKEKAREYIDSN